MSGISAAILYSLLDLEYILQAITSDKISQILNLIILKTKMFVKEKWYYYILNVTSS